MNYNNPCTRCGKKGARGCEHRPPLGSSAQRSLYPKAMINSFPLAPIIVRSTSALAAKRTVAERVKVHPSRLSARVFTGGIMGGGPYDPRFDFYRVSMVKP